MLPRPEKVGGAKCAQKNFLGKKVVQQERESRKKKFFDLTRELASAEFFCLGLHEKKVIAINSSLSPFLSFFGILSGLLWLSCK